MVKSRFLFQTYILPYQFGRFKTHCTTADYRQYFSDRMTVHLIGSCCYRLSYSCLRPVPVSRNEPIVTASSVTKARSHRTNWMDLTHLYQTLNAHDQCTVHQITLFRTDWLHTQRTGAHSSRTPARAMWTFLLVCTCRELEFSLVHMMWTRLKCAFSSFHFYTTVTTFHTIYSYIVDVAAAGDDEAAVVMTTVVMSCSVSSSDGDKSCTTNKK